MSEVQQKEGGGKKGGKPKGKKSSTHIDMTPMVDLAFLLLTFFMMTTSFSKPKVMEIIMPEKPKDEKEQTQVYEKNILNLLLDKNNIIEYYIGIFGKPGVEVKETNYTGKGLRQVIRDAVRTNEQMNGGKDKLVILLKPGEGSTYGNIVDVFDEMNITNAQRYALVDITKEEQQYLNQGHNTQ